MWRFFVGALLVPMALRAEIVPSWTSPILDPSFENQTLITVSPPWSAVGDNVVIDGGNDAKDGQNYVRLGSPTGGWSAVTQRVKIEQRVPHRFAAFIKALGTANDVRLQVLADDGRVLTEKSAAGTREWTQIDLTFTSGDEIYVRFVVGLMAAPGEYVVIDGVQVATSKSGMRQLWVYEGGSYLFEQTQATETLGGKITNKFTEVDRNPEFVEIAQNGTSTRIRLYADYMTLSKGGSSFKRFRLGHWDDRRVWFYVRPNFTGYFSVKPGNKFIEGQTNGNLWEFDEISRNKEEVIIQSKQRNVRVKITEDQSFMSTANGPWEKLWDGGWTSLAWNAFF